jgi:hypothetical protein
VHGEPGRRERTFAIEYRKTLSGRCRGLPSRSMPHRIDALFSAFYDP